MSYCLLVLANLVTNNTPNQVCSLPNDPRKGCAMVGSQISASPHNPTHATLHLPTVITQQSHNSNFRCVSCLSSQSMSHTVILLTLFVCVCLLSVVLLHITSSNANHSSRSRMSFCGNFSTEWNRNREQQDPHFICAVQRQITGAAPSQDLTPRGGGGPLQTRKWLYGTMGFAGARGAGDFV